MDIIAKTDDFYVVYKDEGLSFHHDQGEQDGFFEIFRKFLIETNEDPNIFPVHRLDKVTSGLVIVARHQEAARIFGQMFEQKELDKYYLALSFKKPKKKQGLIKGDMEKSRRGTWKLMATSKNPAVTQFFSYSIVAGLRAFVIKPYTGKTHQIRVALKSIGSAISGDEAYGGGSSDRTYLHAFAVEFKYGDKLYRYKCLPKTGELFNDEDFTKLIQTMDPFELSWPRIG